MCSTGSDIKYTVVMVGVLVMTVVTVVAVTVMVVNMPVMVLMVQVMRAETAGMMVVVMVGLMVVDAGKEGPHFAMMAASRGFSRLLR